MGRPLQEAMQGQQEQINQANKYIASLVSFAKEQYEEAQALRRQAAKQDLVIDYIAHLAGVTPQVTAIRKKADVENPAQPIPNPPSKPATETTEEAVTPEAYDNPMAPGQTPGSVQDLPADTTGTPMDPGATLPTAPYNELTDVTAPVQGTETQRPLPETRTEVDVRVGDPMNPERAFPWTLGPDSMGGGRQSSKQASQESGQDETNESRSMASMRLARLRMQAGVEQDQDDLAVAARIQSDASLSDEEIDHEISTLSKVMKAASSRSGRNRPQHLVPRSSSVQRTTPSLVSESSTMASAASVSDDVADADLFD